MQIQIYFEQNAGEAIILSALNALKIVDAKRVYDSSRRTISLTVKDFNEVGLKAVFPQIEKIEVVEPVLLGGWALD